MVIYHAAAKAKALGIRWHNAILKNSAVAQKIGIFTYIWTSLSEFTQRV